MGFKIPYKPFYDSMKEKDPVGEQKGNHSFLHLHGAMSALWELCMQQAHFTR